MAPRRQGQPQGYIEPVRMTITGIVIMRLEMTEKYVEQLPEEAPTVQRSTHYAGRPIPWDMTTARTCMPESIIITIITQIKHNYSSFLLRIACQGAPSVFCSFSLMLSLVALNLCVSQNSARSLSASFTRISAMYSASSMRTLFGLTIIAAKRQSMQAVRKRDVYVERRNKEVLLSSLFVHLAYARKICIYVIEWLALCALELYY